MPDAASERPRFYRKLQNCAPDPGLRKTRSGKILRGMVRKIADGEDYQMPATMDDPAALAEINKALARAGYTRPGSGSGVEREYTVIIAGHQHRRRACLANGAPSVPRGSQT